MGYFDKQLEGSTPLTEEKIEELSKTTDLFGTENQPGDHILFGLFYKKHPTDEDEHLVAEIHKVNSRSLVLIDDDYEFGGMTGTDSALPRFYLKADFSEEKLASIRALAKD